MLRPGFFVAGMPFNEVMTFVDNEYQIFALFNQNELHQVEPGNEAEITLDTYPGRIIKAHVDSIIWAQAQGQLDASGDLQRTTFVDAAGTVPGEAGRRRSRKKRLPRGRCARRRRDLHRAPHTGAHHPEGLAPGVVVSRLHHHQTQHQVGSLMWFRFPSRSSERPEIASRQRSDTHERRLHPSEERHPMRRHSRASRCRRLLCPANWISTVDPDDVGDNWLVCFQDDQLNAAVVEAIANNAGPARRGGTRRDGDGVCEAGWREVVSFGRSARRGRRRTGGDSSGIQGAVLPRRGSSTCGPCALRSAAAARRRRDRHRRTSSTRGSRWPQR